MNRTGDESRDRVDLGVWATPVEPAPRLAERIGLDAVDLWIKRDDWLGFGGGGNKLRKLEFLCRDAIDRGATVLVTTGAAQSNYARLTAASARRLGLNVVLVLAGDGRDAGSGNLTLDGVFGAEIHWAGEVKREELDAVAAQVAEELSQRGERPALLPYGGSNALGARGYLQCAAEIAEQAPDAQHIVVAAGSGATMAGLVAGLGADRVFGVDAGAVTDIEPRVKTIVAQLVDAGHAQHAVGDEGLRLDRGQIGSGYERMTSRARHAIFDAGSCEGLVLDPVYTAKAFAGLRQSVADGAIVAGERVVFLHTGGLPGLFGHPLAAEIAEGLTRRGASLGSDLKD
jgi:D-cysteine desulfhydrase